MASSDTTNKLIQKLSKKIDTKFAKIDTKLDNLDTKFQFVKAGISRLEDQIEEVDKKAEKRYSKAMDQVAGIAGQFKKFDEERIVLSEHSKRHTDKIEKLEKAVFGVVQI